MVFYDILSRDKIKPLPKQTSEIIIDIHEKNSLIPSIISSKNFSFKFESLKVGDYLIGDSAIERKTLSDLSSSIISKRIFRQLNELKQHPLPILLIEENNKGHKLENNQIRGFILSVLTQYHIPIIFSQDEYETAEYLTLLAKKDASSPSSQRAKKILLSAEENIRYILEGFPGIGPQNSKKLIKKFGSIRNVINASSEELRSILGKKSKSIETLRDFS
jgi:Fanconi anemia group M protein